MAREEFIKVRLSEEEMRLLKEEAKKKGWTMSQVIRELIRQHCG